ncbi:MAG: hypothetical protein RIQ53_3193 [Pseudomonadota bacterium]|jgi:6-phosphogluconolactonase
MCSEARHPGWRGGLTAALLSGLALLAGCQAPLNAPTAAAQTACQVQGTLYGSGETGSVQAWDWNGCEARLGESRMVMQAPKPRWLSLDAEGQRLYVLTDEPAGGQLSVWRTGRSAVELGRAATGGAGPTHLLLDGAARSALVAHFGSGSVARLALAPDGTPQGPSQIVTHTGSGPHRRQASPHAHGLALSPSGRWLLAADMGADRVFIHPHDRTDGRIGPTPARPAVPAFAVPAGSGPRHLVFAPGGRQAYLLNELTADLMVLDWDEARGALSLSQTVALNAPTFGGNRSGAELLLSRDGRHLYVAERGEHTLQVWTVDAASGQLSLAQRMPAGGELPWAMDLSPDGRWLAVALQRTGQLQLWPVERDGRLGAAGPSATLAAPLAVTFAP